MNKCKSKTLYLLRILRLKNNKKTNVLPYYHAIPKVQNYLMYIKNAINFLYMVRFELKL